MISALILLASLQIPTEPVREIAVSSGCAYRAYRDEVICDLHMTVTQPPTSAAADIIVRYECRYRSNLRCSLRSRSPEDTWARERTEDFARRFESRPPSRSMLDGQRFTITYRFPRDAAEFPATPEPTAEN
jgi:hypothetical protein